jgi:hypothetical protein
LADRFWEKVERTESCWLWKAARGRAGYGRLTKGGRSEGWYIASRLAWELTYGPIPDGMHVLHNCPGGDNPTCVNPAHLRLGTDTDNSHDMVAKDRHTRGERSASAKLTDATVLEIRQRWQAENVTQRQLCSDYGISAAAMSMLLAGKTWKHLL